MKHRCVPTHHPSLQLTSSTTVIVCYILVSGAYREWNLDEQNAEIKNRGYNFLIPIGRTWTQHEEKNDVSDRGGSAKRKTERDRNRGSAAPPQADDASDGSDGSDRTGDANSLMDEDENDSSEEEEEDLDADMEDMDQTANNTADLDGDETGTSEESSEEEDSDD